MTRMLAVLAMFLAGPAMAQPSAPTPPSPQQGMAVENVIVTALKERPEEALNNFIFAHAAQSPLVGKISRWRLGICPLTIGLPPKFNQYINQRIIRMAMLAGAPLDSSEPCRPNTLVLATDQPQAVLDFLREKRPGMLGFHQKSQAVQVSTMRRAVQAWYSTATEDFDGFVEVDIPGMDITRKLPGAQGIDGATRVSGSRAIGDGLKSQITTAVIIVDKRKFGGQTIGALADYIAMLALSQATSYEKCLDVPTITNLLAADCAAGMKPPGLTDIDATYLRGLYKMDAGRSFIGERASIAYAMKKELGGY